MAIPKDRITVRIPTSLLVRLQQATRDRQSALGGATQTDIVVSTLNQMLPAGPPKDQDLLDVWESLRPFKDLDPCFVE